jgi:hypothetical protein
MSRRTVVAATLGLSLFLLGAAFSGPPLGTLEPVAPPWVAQRSASSDTVEATVAAGETLIRTLPDATDGTTVASYRMLRGPALSGVAGRSLTWITRNVAPGTYDLRLQARRPGASPDTLVVRVAVQPS